MFHRRENKIYNQFSEIKIKIHILSGIVPNYLFAILTFPIQTLTNGLC